MKTLPNLKASKHNLVSVTSFFMFDTDAEMPNVSYMIHDLSGYHDFRKM